jgi:hypothetical protein
MTVCTGSCLCGSVQFRFHSPCLWSAHCHCLMCQRAHGAAFVTWVGVEQTSFEVTQEQQLRWYHSSGDAQRGFCRQCGSTLFFQSERWPGEMHIVRSNISGDIEMPPSAHVYWESHASWFEFDDPLPRRSS